MSMITANYSFKHFIFKILCIYLKRGEGRKKERERNINVWLPLTWPPLRTWPTAQACAVTGNQSATHWFVALAQSTELHQLGQIFYVVNIKK